MQVLSADINSIIVSKSSSGSSIEHNNVRWSPISFSVTFLGVYESPAWSLWVEDEDEVIPLEEGSFQIIQGMFVIV